MSCMSQIDFLSLLSGIFSSSKLIDFLSLLSGTLSSSELLITVVQFLSLLAISRSLIVPFKVLGPSPVRSLSGLIELLSLGPNSRLLWPWFTCSFWQFTKQSCLSLLCFSLIIFLNSSRGISLSSESELFDLLFLCFLKKKKKILMKRDF